MTTSVTVKVSGDYRATINVKSPPGSRTQTVVVDGDKAREHTFNLTHEAGADIEVREVPLTADMKKERDGEDRQRADAGDTRGRE